MFAVFVRLWVHVTFQQLLFRQLHNLAFIITLVLYLIVRDTAGQERFRTITTAYYRGAMVSLTFSWGWGLPGEGRREQAGIREAKDYELGDQGIRLGLHACIDYMFHYSVVREPGQPLECQALVAALASGDLPTTWEIMVNDQTKQK